MYLDVNAVQHSASLLEGASLKLNNRGSFTGFGKLTSYSAVSGLDQAGRMHQVISSVSQPEATRGLALFLSNAAGLLRDQADGFVAVDAGIGESFRPGGGDVSGGVRISTPDAPLVNSFSVVTPAAGRPWSLEQLVAQLSATDVASMSGISQNWAATSDSVTEALSVIPEVVGLLSGSAETEAIGNAIDHIGLIASSGAQYGINAGVLAGLTAGLVTVSEASSIQAATTLGIVRLAVHPIASHGIEQSYLSGYGPQLTVELVPTVPPFDMLLPPLGSVSGGVVDGGGAGALIPEFKKQALSPVVRDALTHAGWGDVAHATTPAEIVEQVGKPNPDLLDLIASGATPTQVASATAPSLPPISTLPTGGAGAGAAAGAGALAGGATSAVGGLGAAGAGGGLGGAMPLAGRGAAGLSGGVGSGLGGVGAGGRAGAGAGGSGALGARGGFSTPPGAGAGAGTGGVGPAPGNGAGAGTGGVGAGSPGASPRTGGASGSTGGGYGVGPAAGAGRGGRNGQQKRGRVQAVTSAVEREGNLKALLGEAPEVVPGVIGAWVREPKR